MTHIDAIVFEPIGSLTDAAASTPYEDAIPALTELKGLGVALMVASSMPGDALARFLDQSGVRGFFGDVRSADSMAGDLAALLREVLSAAGIAPDRALFITGTADGLTAARAAGAHGILMMND